jgi:hypothetical protein
MIACNLFLALRLVMRILRGIMRLCRVAVCFAGALLPCFVVSLAVVFRCHTMRLGRAFVMLCCFFVRILCLFISPQDFVSKSVCKLVMDLTPKQSSQP